jgi:hypothetical protein
MESNTYSTGSPAWRTALQTALEELTGQDVDRLGDTALVDQALELRQLLDRLEGIWLKGLATVDGRGAAGADQDRPGLSTAGWLRARLRMGAGAAHSVVRTARALYRGPLVATGQALTAGDLSPAHAQVLACGTQDLAPATAAEAEPVLLEVARRLDPPRLRRAITHLRLVADPDGADTRAEHQHQQRGVWVSPTWEGMVAVNGLLEAEAAQTLLAALDPLARPSDARDERSASQRRADALAELARRNLESGQLPQSGGVRPQLLVTVELDSLLDHPGGLGGDTDGVGPLDPEACRRLACDGAVTRVLVSRRPPGHGGHGGGNGADDHDRHDHGGRDGRGDHGHDDHGRGAGGVADLLRAAATRLPPTLGGAPAQPLEVGRASRVVTAAQRAALVVRDGGCAVPDCQRPPGWCEAHHLVHWLHGGPTDLQNLALLCRAHHRAVHEGGWRLGRDPDGHLTATPPHRKPRAVA